MHDMTFEQLEMEALMPMKMAYVYLLLIGAGIISQSNVRALGAEKCEFSSPESFNTWFKDTSTGSPVLFPKTIDELRSILSEAGRKGCKLRVRGAGHSRDGIVMQKMDSLRHDTVVVHLKDLEFPEEYKSWNNGSINETSPSVKISAGASLIELNQIIRPAGYLLPSSTAGRLFSVGGAFLNPSVHGSIFDEGRLTTFVLSVLYIDGNGTLQIAQGTYVHVDLHHSGSRNDIYSLFSLSHLCT
jgi:FAD/FMN-containing dehydrogenase